MIHSETPNTTCLKLERLPPWLTLIPKFSPANQPTVPTSASLPYQETGRHQQLTCLQWQGFGTWKARHHGILSDRHFCFGLWGGIGSWRSQLFSSHNWSHRVEWQRQIHLILMSWTYDIFILPTFSLLGQFSVSLSTTHIGEACFNKILLPKPQLQNTRAVIYDSASLFCSCFSQFLSCEAKASAVLEVSSKSKHLKVVRTCQKQGLSIHESTQLPAVPVGQ